MTCGYGATCGYMGTQWRGRADSAGALRIPYPGYFFRTYVFEGTGEACSLLLVAETDGHRAYHPLEISDLGSAPVSPVRLRFAEADEDAPDEEWTVARVGLRPGSSRSVADRFLRMAVVGDPHGPLERNHWFSYVRVGKVNLSFRRGLPSDAKVLIECRDDAGDAWRTVLHPASYKYERDVTVALGPAPESVTGVVVDSSESPIADARVTLLASLPMRDHPRDRAAAIRSPRDPLDPSRLLWAFRHVQVDDDGRFAFPEPWSAFAGDDPRWYLVAEQRGWWRGDPVRIAGAGSTARLVLPAR